MIVTGRTVTRDHNFPLVLRTFACTMVVAQTKPSTSGERPRKTRRSMKKKAPRTVDKEVDHELKAASKDDDELMIDTEPTFNPQPTAAPEFSPLSASAHKATLKSEARRIPIPPHRMTPLKKDWINIFGPLTEMLGLQVRMNVQRKCIEIRVSVIHPVQIMHRLMPRRPAKQPKILAHCKKAQTSQKLMH